MPWSVHYTITSKQNYRLRHRFSKERIAILLKGKKLPKRVSLTLLLYWKMEAARYAPSSSVSMWYDLALSSITALDREIWVGSITQLFSSLSWFFRKAPKSYLSKECSIQWWKPQFGHWKIWGDFRVKSAQRRGLFQFGNAHYRLGNVAES